MKLVGPATAFTIEWFDHEREPACPPNPAYPDGVHLDCSEGMMLSCLVELPYPARRCGLYRITCQTCQMRIGITTAGRPDDPRSVRVACMIAGRA